MTKRQLAEAADVSTRSLIAYESGSSQPNPLTLQRLSSALGFPVAFLVHQDDLDELPAEAPSFRAFSRLTARERDQAFAAGALALSLNSWIEQRFDLPEADIPRLRSVDPETAAETVREMWGLGSKPIPNMLHLLEKHGVRVYSLGDEYANVDAFSVWHRETPLMFATRTKSPERRRMDAAHELGHLVLHSRHSVPRGREFEREADLFASAFLMPKADVIAQMQKDADLDSIIVGKRRWRVSAKALIYRMHAVGMLSEWRYRDAFVKLAERGYSSSEPAGITAESSQVLDKVFAALRSEGVTRADVATDLNLQLPDLEELVFGLTLVPVHGTGGESEDDENVTRPQLRLV